MQAACRDVKLNMTEHEVGEFSTAISAGNRSIPW
jgi:hypothetical protein